MQPTSRNHYNKDTRFFNNTTPPFEKEDEYNSTYKRLVGRGSELIKHENLIRREYTVRTGKMRPKGCAPTIQVSIYASHNCIIHIQQTYTSFFRTDSSEPDSPPRELILSNDIYEYTTPNKPMFIQRTLGFLYYRVVCENPNEEDIETLYLTTQLVNHPAITQGIIL